MKAKVQPGETLAQFVKRVREANNWSTRDVDRQSGGEISDSYVQKIEKGEAINPSPQKLMGLAKGLQLDPDAFNAAIYGTPSALPEMEQRLLNIFRRCDERAQADTLVLARALSEARPNNREVPLVPEKDDFTENKSSNGGSPTREVGKNRTKTPHSNK